MYFCCSCIYVFYSPQDIEQFKAEIEKRQLKELPIPGVLGELGSEEKEQKMETDAADS